MKAWARQLARAPEATVAIVVGLLFTIAGLLNWAEGDALSEVTLLVLSVIALSVVRDRSSREDVSRAMRRLDEDVRALVGDEPYHVLHYTSAMNIQQGGSLAYGTRTKHIRFHHNTVLSISDRSQSTGISEHYSCRPKPLKIVDRFGGVGERQYLISLGRPWKRDEELEFTIEERLRDAFLEDREDVAVDIESPTDELVLTVTWSADRAVEAVYVERFGKETRVPDSDIQPAEGGGSLYTVRFANPQVGEALRVLWDWAEPLAHASGDDGR